MVEHLPVIKTIMDILISAWRFIGKSFHSKNGIYYPIPKRTIIVAPNPDPHNTRWHMGGMLGKPEVQAMQVVGQVKVTNITKYGIVLSAAKMSKPKYMGHVMVMKSNSNYIPPRGFTDLDFHFWIIPPFKKEGEDFIADIAILDQFGNEHWLRKGHFVYT